MKDNFYFVVKYLILINIILFSIVACKIDGDIEFVKLDKTIDLKDYGTFNSFKVFDNTLLLLDATNSELSMFDKDSLYSIMKIDIKNRSFLQDFDISDSLFYFSNTYDEIFVLNDNAKFIDTILVSNPNKIVLINENRKLFVTERISKYNSPRIILKNLEIENEINMIELENLHSAPNSVTPLFNSEIVMNKIKENTNEVSIISNRTKKLYLLEFHNIKDEMFQLASYKISTDKLSRYNLDEKFFSSFKFGSFNYTKEIGLVRIIAENSFTNNIYLLTFEIKDSEIIIKELKQFNEKFDITTCAFSKDSIYTYDYLNQKLLIYRTNCKTLEK